MRNLETNTKPSLAIAGTLLFLSGSITFMGIITGEVFYPSGYTTSVNDISDLGGTRPPNSIIHQPSATIFNVTMMLTGIMIIISAWFVHKYFRKRIASLPLGLFGLGLLGVGIFPGNVSFYHGLFSMITFISGGVAAITSFKITSPPYRYMGICFGVIALVFLFFANYFIPILGSGGTERWVAYPIALWLTGFGGYLLGMRTTTSHS